MRVSVSLTRIKQAALLAGFSLVTGFANAAANAQFIHQSVPREMEAGMRYQVTVTFKNTGDETWTKANGYRLSAWDPSENWKWFQGGRVDLADGEQVVPGATKTFTFFVFAPPMNAQGYSEETDGPWGRDERTFRWRMIREGVAWFGEANTSFYSGPLNDSELISTRFKDEAHKDWSESNRRLERVARIEVYPKINLTPSIVISKAPASVVASQLDFQNMRGANILQSSVNSPEIYIPDAMQMEKIANAAANMKLNFVRLHVHIPPNGDTATLSRRYNQAKTAIDIAYSYGIRTIVTLVGYNGYSTQCGWRIPFVALESSAKTIVQNLASHPGVFAWDLNNEPFWEAFVQGCSQQGLSNYQDTINGVYAMYNLVRANDPYNKPTTVGDGKLPYVRHWMPISSFLSPHIYVDAVSLDLNLYESSVASLLKAYKDEAGGKPVVVGEYGFGVGEHVTSDAAASDAYSSFFKVAKSSGINVGSFLWTLSTDSDQAKFSVLNTDGSWKPAANVIATQVVATNNSAFVDWTNVPTVLARGESRMVNIRMKNVGSTNWFLRQYKLGSRNATWGVDRVTLSTNPIEIVAPGQTKTFSFIIKAPSVPGSYAFQWQMLREGFETFGATTPLINIAVP